MRMNRKKNKERRPMAMVTIKMSNGPVVVAETAFTLSRGTPWEWVCIKQKKSSDYEERPRLQRSVDRR